MQLKSLWTIDDIRQRLPANGGVGFLFHATDPETVQFAFEAGEFSEEDYWRQPPFIDSPIFLDNRVIGCHIVSALPAQLWAGSHSTIRRFRSVAYEPSLRMAAGCGLTHVGLGALIPFATQYGQHGHRPEGLRLTTGHAATVAAIWQTVVAVASECEVRPELLQYAIFGAAGSIGANTAQWFARQGCTHLRLIDVPERLPRLHELAAQIRPESPFIAVSCHVPSDLTTFAEFDIAVIATNRAEPWIDANLLRKAAVWIDDSHPRAVLPEAEAALASDVMYLECYLRGPHGLSQTFPFRLPTSRDCYSCFAEVFICWMEKMTSDFVVGTPSLEKINLMDRLLPQHGFVTGPFVSKSGREIRREQLQRASRRLQARSRVQRVCPADTLDHLQGQLMAAS
jgi:predicted amino acid dehydrogenase